MENFLPSKVWPSVSYSLNEDGTQPTWYEQFEKELRQVNKQAEEKWWWGNPQKEYLQSLNRGQGKLNAHTMQSIIPSNWEIISYVDNPDGSRDVTVKPHSIRRLPDTTVFTIGDVVTNGTPMTGEIIRFELLKNRIFVITTWSGVGMNLESLSHVVKLPSQFQPTEEVALDFYGHVFKNVRVAKVHFASGSTTYDLTVTVVLNEKRHEFRLYNVDSRFVISKKV